MSDEALQQKALHRAGRVGGCEVWIFIDKREKRGVGTTGSLLGGGLLHMLETPKGFLHFSFLLLQMLAQFHLH